MADNITLNTGTGGSVVATDDVSGFHYQRMKLTDGTADSSTAINSGNGTATNALRVTVASDSTGVVGLAAGSASVGTVGLNAGSNAIGTVSLNAALPAGTAYVGKVRVTDGTNDLTLDTNGADNEAATEITVPAEAYNMLFNGSTWDRQRGSVTVNKVATYTTAQTGTALWTPAAGKAVVITMIQIQSYGTTAGTCQVWFGGSADTAYTRGTDAAVFDGEFAPSATNKPGFAMTFPNPLRGTADFVLRVTTTNAQSVTINVWGYEI